MTEIKNLSNVVAGGGGETARIIIAVDDLQI